MQRAKLQDLKIWFQTSPPKVRKPLVLRGARQVGKSYLVRDFCRRCQLDLMEINFERDPSLKSLFVEGHNRLTIKNLELHFGRAIGAQTLLFLDEIQSASHVLARLRYFYEDTPEVAVIAAGSLLKFVLSDASWSMPVGRLNYLHLCPMTFEEFLLAGGKQAWVSQLQELSASLKDIPFGEHKSLIPDFLHTELLKWCQDFARVGGLPEAVERYLLGSDSGPQDFRASSESHRSLLATYRDDFSKYRNRIPLVRLQCIFDQVPSSIGKKWIHARINPDEKAQATQQALLALCHAGVVHRVHHSGGNQVPLGAEIKESLFKTFFLDVGLAAHLLGVSGVPAGALWEQWVGQELLALQPAAGSPPSLHYWVREKAGAQAEVDYLIPWGDRVVPVEVKAGSAARARSLDVFMRERPSCPWGLFVSSAPLHWDGARKVLSLPYYLLPYISQPFL